MATPSNLSPSEDRQNFSLEIVATMLGTPASESCRGIKISGPRTRRIHGQVDFSPAENWMGDGWKIGGKFTRESSSRSPIKCAGRCWTPTRSVSLPAGRHVERACQETMITVRTLCTVFITWPNEARCQHPPEPVGSSGFGRWFSDL